MASRASTRFKLGLACLVGFGSTCPARAATQAPPNPPYPNVLYETPASLNCVYQTVTPLKAGCNPNDTTLTQNLTLGAHAIVVISQYHTPSLQADLNAYSTQFGLPSATVTVTTNSSAATCTTVPTVNSSLRGRYDTYNCHSYENDVIQVAHAMAPSASLYVLEMPTGQAASALGTYATQAAAIAKNAGGGEVLFLRQAAETSDETNSETAFTSTANPNVLFFAATGSNGSANYPGTSPNVVSVSTSYLARDIENPNNVGNFLAEKAGQVGGAGFSAYLAAPTYQNRIANRVGGTNKRAVPDIVAGSDGTASTWVYNNGRWIAASGPYLSVGIAAGIANAARASEKFQSTASLLTSLYAKINTPAFADIGTGICGPYDGAFTTVADRNSPFNQWDFCSGIGAPRGLSGFQP